MFESGILLMHTLLELSNIPSKCDIIWAMIDRLTKSVHFSSFESNEYGILVSEIISIVH